MLVVGRRSGAAERGGDVRGEASEKVWGIIGHDGRSLAFAMLGEQPGMSKPKRNQQGVRTLQFEPDHIGQIHSRRPA